MFTLHFTSSYQLPMGTICRKFRNNNETKSRFAFYCHIPKILNNIGDKIFLLTEQPSLTTSPLLVYHCSGMTVKSCDPEMSDLGIVLFLLF